MSKIKDWINRTNKKVKKWSESSDCMPFVVWLHGIAIFLGTTFSFHSFLIVREVVDNFDFESELFLAGWKGGFFFAVWLSLLFLIPQTIQELVDILKNLKPNKEKNTE